MSTDRLAQFLLARNDDDEMAARASIALYAEAGVDESTWEVDELGPGDREPYEVVIYPERGGSVTVARTWRTECGRVNADHIARWDPARVLADVAAKRAILAAHRDALRECDRAAARVRADMPLGQAAQLENEARLARKHVKVATLEMVVQALVNAWPAHADFDEAWRIDVSPAADRARHG